jgi:hypothetical protein
MAVKGVPLSAWLYADPALCDIDVLVDEIKRDLTQWLGQTVTLGDAASIALLETAVQRYLDRPC